MSGIGQIGMMEAKGKTYVKTQAGEALAVRPIMGFLELPNGQRLQVKRAWDNVPAATTDRELIPAVEGAAIRILALNALAGGTATEVTFNSQETGQAGAAMGPLYAFGANGGMVLPFNEQGWFQTPEANRAVSVTTGAGAAVGVAVSYVEIPEDAFDVL